MRDRRRGGGADQFGALLRSRRELAGLTQEELAERARLGVRTIRYLERGRCHPRPSTVRLLGQALGLAGPALARFDAAARRRRAEAAAGPAAVGHPAVPAQLPAGPAGFTGRTGLLAELDELLPDHPGGPPGAAAIAALTGTAGIGKTALAVHWAHRAATRFPDGQLYLDLRGHGPGAPLRPIQALGRLLRTLGAGGGVPAATDEAAGLYRSLLAGRRVLVVLDAAQGAEQVRPLLPGGPGCVVLVTSRDPLAGLIASHGARWLGVEALEPGEALTLLACMLGRDRVAAEPDAAAELARACGYLPSALRAAAAQLACHPGQPIAQHLAQLLEQRLAATRLYLVPAGRRPLGRSPQALPPNGGRLSAPHDLR
jgi:transcriptional regulator with XRE-family HTH domain